MGPVLENKQNTDMILEASAKKQNGTDSKELEASHVNCASNYEDHTSFVEQVKGVHGSEDDEIDITECTKPANNVLVESDKEELTESSSSFESIISEAENCCTTMSDAECTSEYNGDATSRLAFSGFGDIFRMTYVLLLQDPYFLDIPIFFFSIGCILFSGALNLMIHM